MKFSPAALGGFALVLSLSAGPARAEFIHWSYNWSRSPAKVVSDNHPGTGYLTLTDESLKSAVGNSSIVATNLRAFSTATTADPDVFTAKKYTFSLYLLDQDSGKSATLTFTGQLDGTLTASSSNIKNTFLGKTTQSVVLGNNLYTVTMDHYSPPGPTGAINAGSISAFAAVSVSAFHPMPEPGGLLLSGVGAALAGLAGWRRRRALAV